MKNLALLCCLFAAFAAESLRAEDALWRDLDARQVGAFELLAAEPERFRALTLDAEAMRFLLRSAPLEPVLVARYPNRRSDETAIIITLPAPDGQMVPFAVHDSPVMADALAQRFPEIQTYQAVSTENPATLARLSMTPKGFRAMVLDVDRGTWFIDPLRAGQDQDYGSYLKTDYLHDRVLDCGVNEHFAQESGSDARGGVSNAGTLRTYRLAVAATGEYTQFHGGAIRDSLAEITVAMNRVNGIYQRDIGLRMELVNTNDQIIYTNAATDPYTNNSGGAMLGQNQVNLDVVIGSANYDIGHVFSTGGGGIAGLGVVCRGGSKARGVTGLNNPINDPFYVDYVAHELGHQWGGNHTFNGSAGACSGGNRNGSTAYEPGSGATIQAYAGICGAQNIQNNSDDYFHGISLDEMITYSTLGSGDNCPQYSATGNQAPEVAAGPDYTIPANTPFELCGSADDPDLDPLSYAWEQFDLGPAGAPENPSGNAPIFRSFQPTTSPCRIFPRRSDLLNGTETIGEQLPSYARTLTFRLIARDNSAPAGGVGSAEMNVVVSNTGSAFQVVAPQGGERWLTAVPQTVSWAVAGTDQEPISCAEVDIRLSADGGQTFTEDLLLDAPNTGSAQVILQTETPTARIEVRCSDNIFLAISPADFDVRSVQIFQDRFEDSNGMADPDPSPMSPRR